MKRTVEDRFWSKVAIAGPDERWEWTRSLNSNGYGQFRVSTGESPKKASRVAWALTYGDPGRLWVLHHCDNPPCCNPHHLFLGTARDNTADMVSKGRAVSGMAGGIPLREFVRHLTDAQIREARRAHVRGESCRSIARRFRCSHTTISRLVSGKHWRNYGAAA